MNRYYLYLPAAFLIAGLMTGFYPAADLAAAGYFYAPPAGFVHVPVLDFLHKYGPGLLIAGAAVFSAVLFVKKKLSRKEFFFVAGSFALGPGLIVNALLKEHYGRARPVQVENFGGQAHFTPALQIADQCHHNCSFTAGDPSVGFALICFALLFPRHGKVLTSFSLLVGAALGLMRIAQGGHFLSDVLFTAFFTLASTIALYWLMFVQQNAHRVFLHKSIN